MPHDETIRERALEWVVRVDDPEFTDWEGFTAWLDESPAHAAAYDAVQAAVDDAAALAEALPPAEALPLVANDDASAAPRFGRRWAMVAMAASLALVAGLTLWPAAGGRYSVETAPGEVRTVALADGGSVVLAGGTRLELDRKDDRFARLERGQALFTVHHDERRPFAVEVGADRLVDAGTVFDVEMSERGMQVAVSEGLVVFNPGKQDVKVAPGQMLARRAGANDYALTRVTSEQVGEWREGRLTFDGAPLDVVAARLSRMTGQTFMAKAGGGAFTGSLLVAPLRQDPASLGPLLGAKVRQDGDRWVISAD